MNSDNYADSFTALLNLRAFERGGVMSYPAKRSKTLSKRFQA
ncbi:hypothetical protein GECvBMG_gp226 [Salmonella phage GEC_vB_MG]|nr:hypothetical protein GECvBMG_gp226 [Salmonella phage GEC_vB_MG]